MVKNRDIAEFLGLSYPSSDERGVFGEGYTPPDRFRHGVAYEVARFPAERAGQCGQDVTIEETRMPARFYTIRVAPRESDTHPKRGLVLGTGSDMAELAVAVARAFAGGMLAEEDQ